MPLSDRHYMRTKHPPNCTCVDCINRRLGIKPSKYHKKIKNRRMIALLKSIIRILLNLFTVAGLIAIAWYGYIVFGHDVKNTVVGALIFLAGLLIWVLFIKYILRLYRRIWPSFKLTTFSIIIIVIVLAFAGVKPISGYKDSLITNIDSFIEEYRSGGGQLSALSNEESVAIQDYEYIFNEYRISNGLEPLIFTDDLNNIAVLRLEELFTDYSHHSQGSYNIHLAENIAMSYEELSNSSALVMWKNSPGHNANMLNSSYKNTGYANGNGYAVQLFTEWETLNGEPELPPGWYFDD